MTYQAGIITTVAGTGERGYAGDGGPAAGASLSEPFMCAFDAAGNMYVAEAMNHCIRRVDRATERLQLLRGLEPKVTPAMAARRPGPRSTSPTRYRWTWAATSMSLTG